MTTEADTCRTLITPKLQAAGWDSDPHSIAEQRFFTDGRIIVLTFNAPVLKPDSYQHSDTILKSTASPHHCRIPRGAPEIWASVSPYLTLFTTAYGF